MLRPGCHNRLGQSSGTGFRVKGLGDCTHTQGPVPWHGMEQRVLEKVAL